MLCALLSAPLPGPGPEGRGTVWPWPPPPECAQCEEKVQLPIKCCGPGAPRPRPPPSGSGSGLPEGPGAQAPGSCPSGLGRARTPVFRGEGPATQLHVCLSGAVSTAPHSGRRACVWPSHPALCRARPQGLQGNSVCECCFSANTGSGPARRSVRVRSPAAVRAPQSVFTAHLTEGQLAARTRTPRRASRGSVSEHRPPPHRAHTRGCRTSITLKGSHSPPHLQPRHPLSRSV